MDSIYFKVTDKENTSFHIQENYGVDAYDQLHHHPEYQISFILEGRGVSSVGNCLEPFQSGDIYFIGANVPHVFRFETKKEHPVIHILSLFFDDQSFGNQFFKLPELIEIQSFLKTTSRGLKLALPHSNGFVNAVHQLKQVAGIDRMIDFLSLLKGLSLNKDWKFLCSAGYAPSQITELYQPMNRIFKYISDNFDQTIALEKVAAVANLSKYAFCRYFKKITHKSFIHYLNEYRVGVACSLLHSSSYSIAQVGFQTGFNNLSNFNRQFKKFMHCTPSRYRELYHRYFGSENK